MAERQGYLWSLKTRLGHPSARKSAHRVENRNRFQAVPNCRTAATGRVPNGSLQHQGPVDTGVVLARTRRPERTRANRQLLTPDDRGYQVQG